MSPYRFVDTGVGLLPEQGMAQAPALQQQTSQQGFDYQCVGAQNCGDAVALAVNPYLQGTKLPRGGLGEGEIREVAKAYKAPVFDRNQLSLEQLQQLGPGTIIRMTRKKGDKNYEYGDTHAETLTTKDGNLVVASFTPGKGVHYKPLTQQYVNELPRQTIATNLIGGRQFAMEQRLAELQGRDARQSTGGNFMSTGMQFFISKGYSPAQAAGIVGNLMHESGGRPDITHDKGAGIGLAGWNGARRKALYKFAGTDKPTVEQQLEFVDYELKNDFNKAYNELLKTNTPEKAAEIFSRLYERPGKPMMGERIKHAQKAITNYAMGQAGSMAADVSGRATPGGGGLEDILAQARAAATKKTEQVQSPMGQYFKFVNETPQIEGEQAVMQGAPEAMLAKPKLPVQESIIGVKLGTIDVAGKAARAIDPDWGAAAMGYMPTEPRSEDVGKRVDAATNRLMLELFPNGVPKAKTMEAQVIRGIAESWPGLLALGAMAGLPASVAFGLWGLTDEKPLEGALKGALLGGTLQGMHKLTQAFESPVGQWLAKIGGGAAVGGGATAAMGGTPQDITRDAIIFGFFEAMGMPKKNQYEWLKNVGVPEKDVAVMATASPYSPEFAEALNRAGEKLLLPAGQGFTLVDKPKTELRKDVPSQAVEEKPRPVVERKERGKRTVEPIRGVEVRKEDIPVRGVKETAPTETVESPPRAAEPKVDKSGKADDLLEIAKKLVPVKENVKDIEGLAQITPLGIKLKGSLKENLVPFWHEVAHELDSRSHHFNLRNDLIEAVDSALENETRFPKTVDKVEVISDIYSIAKTGDNIGLLKRNPKWKKVISILDDILIKSAAVPKPEVSAKPTEQPPTAPAEPPPVVETPPRSAVPERKASEAPVIEKTTPTDISKLVKDLQHYDKTGELPKGYKSDLDLANDIEKKLAEVDPEFKKLRDEKTKVAEQIDENSKKLNEYKKDQSEYPKDEAAAEKLKQKYGREADSDLDTLDYFRERYIKGMKDIEAEGKRLYKERSALEDRMRQIRDEYGKEKKVAVEAPKPEQPKPIISKQPKTLPALLKAFAAADPDTQEVMRPKLMEAWKKAPPPVQERNRAEFEKALDVTEPIAKPDLPVPGSVEKAREYMDKGWEPREEEGYSNPYYLYSPEGAERWPIDKKIYDAITAKHKPEAPTAIKIGDDLYQIVGGKYDGFKGSKKTIEKLGVKIFIK